MAKPKHPTVRSLRQGQTIYCVVNDSLLYGEVVPKRVVSYFLYSHNEPLPPLGCIVERLPVSNIKRAIKEYQTNMRVFFYSRRRAEKCAEI